MVSDQPASSFSVLCVDDDPTSLRLLDGIVSDAASQVFTAKDGREALYVFARHSPDVVISDIMMPRMNGVELGKALREISPHTPLIFATAFDDKKLLKDAIALGVDDYVVKPLDRNQLLEAVLRCGKRVAQTRLQQAEMDFAKRMLRGLPHPAILLQHPSCRVLAMNELAEALLGRIQGHKCAGPFCPGPLMERFSTDAFTIEKVYKTLHQQGVEFAGKVWDLFVTPVSPNEMLVTGVDVTERTRTEQMRQDVERIVRHDMKTPLNGVIGLAQLLKEGPLEEDQKTLADLIYDNGRRLLRMISLPLDLYKMEHGEFKPSPLPVDLLEIVRQAAQELQLMARDRRQTIMLMLDDAPLPAAQDGKQVLVYGQDLHFASIVTNIMQNAVEAAPKESVITVRVYSGSPVRLETHNIGVVPEPVRDSFFDRYVTYGKKDGTGLGAYTSKLIANAYGGNIYFTTSVEDGTRVHVTLPG